MRPPSRASAPLGARLRAGLLASMGLAAVLAACASAPEVEVPAGVAVGSGYVEILGPG